MYKLLNAVLQTNIQQDDYCIKNNILSYSYCRCDNEWCTEKINIYELAFQCKAWALKNNFNITSMIVKDGGKCEIYNKFQTNYNTKKIKAETEIEAIFKACEWVLEQIQNKKD